MTPSAGSYLARFTLFTALTACGGHNLEVGREGDAGIGADDGGETLEAGSCTMFTLGTARAPSSNSDCQNLFVGRWGLCSYDGGAPPDDSGFPYFLPQPEGIEFVQDNGALQAYVLVPDDGGALVRSQDPSQRAGATDPATLGSACEFWMAPDSHPGEQTRWSVVRYTNPDSMLINGDATYVPL